MNAKIEGLSSEEDVKALFQYLKAYIPDDDREDIHIRLYLAALHKSNRLLLPIKVEKGESPDYRLLTGGETIGVEHTAATHEQYQELRRAIEKEEKDVIFETDIFKPGRKVPRRLLKEQIVKEDEGLKGAGHAGWSAEEEFVEFCKLSLIAKTLLLNKPHFSRFPRNVLIVEDDSPIMVRIRPEIVAKIIANLNYWDAPLKHTFDEVVICLDGNLIFWTPDKINLVDVSKRAL